MKSGTAPDHKGGLTVRGGKGDGGHRLGILFATVLVDLIGFGIVLPILPLYAAGFGARGLETGLLISVYSLVQLVMAPLWGRLSDRFGRRPILILGLLGSAVAYFIFARADSLAMLFLSRIIGGIGGSTIPVAQAYIADVTPPERRAGNMGLIGAAFGLGFVIGPLLGGPILSPLSPGEPTVPGYTAAALCLANAIAAILWLPESRGRGGATTASRFDLRAALARVASSRQILLTLATYLCITMAFSTLQPTLSPLASQRFGMGAREAGYLFGLLGAVSAIVQGGIVRRLVPRTGELALLRASALPFAVGLALVGLSSGTPLLLTGLVLLGIGYGGAIPSILGLLSRAVEPERQGAVLGVGQSVGSCARVIGPSMAGSLFDVRLFLPYLAGAALIVVATAISAGLRQPRGQDP
ncbi:MAG: MFS transporter [Gemmatimonadetes bacterium]|nr:MFS transporter [Gemmatimonadota bacterium]MYD13656.1 MFS transporter [Gemmatimonadota bacterium]